MILAHIDQNKQSLNRTRPLRYFILPLGCQMNSSDTERITSVLEDMGYEPTRQEDEADLLGVVSCSVRQKAIDRVYGRIHQWNKWKDKRSLITFVSGCILPADEKKFLKLFDLLFKIDDLPRLPDIFDQYGMVTPIRGISRKRAGIRTDFDTHFWDIQPKYSSPFQAFVPIQNGCDKFCTFCAVPYTRGREISRGSKDILNEVGRLVEKGYKSITLLGQNVNSYGHDKKEDAYFFKDLMEDIGKIGTASKKDFWVYFTSPHPRDMTRDVLETMAKYPCLANNIHLPLQSGDDRILKKMNRSYTINHYENIVRWVREILPLATLFTDIIVGFPDEEEEHFLGTRQAMDQFQFHMAYIAQYSPRPGAVSARWDDTVSADTKKSRFRILTTDLMRVASAQNEKQAGKILPVLIEAEGRKKGFLMGRTEGRIPIRIASSDKSLIGSFALVRVTKALSLSLEGEVDSLLPAGFLQNPS